MKDNLPKVIFKQMPLELETEMFFEFLDTNWASKITNEFPEFLKIKSIVGEKDNPNKFSSERKLERARKKAIEKIIIKIRKEFNEKMSTGLKNIKSEWEKVEKKVLEILSDIIQTDWLEKEITGFVSINPVCPRFLDTWGFSVTYNRKDSDIIIAHEISHFLYFKKFKKIFPEIGKDKYEFPNKEWVLSEIITPIILNDSRMIKIIGPGAGFYEKHKELKIGEKPLTESIQELYTEFVINKNDFSEFIKKSLDLVNLLK